jgi:LysR family hydrogen peroxide-inducible transcriptional activator
MRPLPTLRQFRYLVAVAEHRHFGRAAEDCLVTQSTLSAGIRELENVLGATLIARGSRNVTLTPVGEEIVARAQKLLLAAEELVDAAHIGSRPLTGLLRLGVIPTVGPYLLPRVLPRLRQSYPDLRLYLREEQTARVLEMLGRGRVDGGIIALPYATGDLETMLLGDDPLLVACPKSHAFAARGSIGGADLAREALMLLEDGHCLRNHALAACRLLPGHPNEELQATSLSTLVQMVGNGFGLTLIPQLAVDLETHGEPNIAVVPFADGRPSRQIALVWRAQSARSRDLRLLGEVLRAGLSASPPAAAGPTSRQSDDDQRTMSCRSRPPTLDRRSRRWFTPRPP